MPLVPSSCDRDMGLLKTLWRLLIVWAVVWVGVAMMDRPDMGDATSRADRGAEEEEDDGEDETFVPLKWIRQKLSPGYGPAAQASPQAPSLIHV